VEWSEGRVPSADEPADFAAEWLSRREEKAENTGESGDEAPKKSPDPATAQKRADRVAGGLVELDLWITDQIRSGLAAMDTSWAGFDAVAARMVDAQAPGIAGTLRALAGIVASTENWPEKVLDELARLHLLVAAHQKLSKLPEDLAYSVKAHVGYPVSTESVMESIPVKENWMILGSGITEEKRLFTRTVWMLGRNSKRWAMLLDFSHGSPNFATETPPVGFLLNADVHFYPGAAALRARMGATHGEPEPFTTMPFGSIDAALQQFTDALAADPWLRSWPAVISSVVPSFVDGSWFLVDESGTALRAEGDSDLLWKLLGISGGYPVTVCGTWNALALTPISVFAGGQVIVL